MNLQNLTMAELKRRFNSARITREERLEIIRLALEIWRKENKAA